MDSRAPLRARAAALLLVVMLAWGCVPEPAAPPAPSASAPPSTSAAPAPTTTPAAPPAPSASASPSASATGEPAGCPQTSGGWEQRELTSPALPRPLRVDVYLPPCYDAERADPYPLLVLLHGQGFTQDQWARLGLPAAAGRLASPVLIALPYEHDNLSNPFETGYEAALVNDLLPWLAEEYHACAQRGCRAIGGLSRGASWAVRIGLIHWDRFAAVGAHSLPSFYGDPERTPGWAAEIPAGQAPRLWLDSGEHDRYLTQAREYHQLLDRLGIAHEWRVWPGEHDEAYWSAHVEDYLRWYIQSIEVPSTGLES